MVEITDNDVKKLLNDYLKYLFLLEFSLEDYKKFFKQQETLESTFPDKNMLEPNLKRVKDNCERRLKEFEQLVDDCVGTGEGSLTSYTRVNRNGGELYTLKITLYKE